MNLYEKYLEMNKVAAEQETMSQEEEARIQVILEKTAEAQGILKEAGVESYTDEELADVVTALITNQVEEEEAVEKIAELEDMGRIMFHGFQKEAAKYAE